MCYAVFLKNKAKSDGYFVEHMIAPVGILNGIGLFLKINFIQYQKFISDIQPGSRRHPNPQSRFRAGSHDRRLSFFQQIVVVFDFQIRHTDADPQIRPKVPVRSEINIFVEQIGFDTNFCFINRSTPAPF